MEKSDFLVLGSGIAGLMYALKVAEHGTVTVLCKGEPSEGSTRYAQGGIASVTSPLDSFEAHIQDTLDCGAGLCHEDIVRSVVSEGPERIAELIQLGTHFDTESSGGEFRLGREGGHSARRILHAGDATGAEIQRAVYTQAAKHPKISIRPFHTAIDFIHRDNQGRSEVHGVYAYCHRERTVKTFVGRTTMIATGGVGKVYLYTTNPDVATGDGIAMAYRAGAKIANLEFIQFHPTCLYHPQAKSFLITEAMRGEGAKIRTIAGDEFLGRYDSRAELAPRDIVARAIDDMMKKTGDDYVLLDISHRPVDFVRERFPTIYERTKALGFDITKGPIPVVPAAHYCCGGVRSEASGQTSLARLYAAGEAACTGLHGANRLASNSLLEAVVFAHRAAAHTIEHFSDYSMPNSVKEWDTVGSIKSQEEVIVSHLWDEVRRAMWNLVGIVRSDKRLALAKRRIQSISDEIRDYYWSYTLTPDLIELRNIVQLAAIIIDSALTRKESRGLHYNIDYPKLDDVHCRRDSVIAKGQPS